jgi:hypothetical protein
MRVFLVFLFILPAFAQAQSEEARMLFLAVNSKRSELNYPSLSYQPDKQTENDMKAIRFGIDNDLKSNCYCKSEMVLTASSLKELLSSAIDLSGKKPYLDPEQKNATVSVVNFEGKYFAVIRTY